MKDIDYEINRICEFIRESVAKTKSNGVIIALSGGLDSSVVAALSAKAIGAEQVHCYFLRYKYASLETDKRHTEELCNKFGITYGENRFVSKTSGASVEPNTSQGSPTIRYIANTVNTFNVNNEYLHMILGNIEAVMRSGYLYKKATKHNSLVLGTTNRSELRIGYFTKFEKSGCHLQPILHLYKTEIVEMARHLGIPEEIINRVPSADLWYGQADEKGLTYQKLDRILRELDRMRNETRECKPDDITEEEVSQCMNMVKKAKQKQKGRFPPCLNEGLYVP
jgi:NAD+ synthase